MSNDLGACVVALPIFLEELAPVEGGPHVTLAYLGDDKIDDPEVIANFQQILTELASEVDNDFFIKTKGIEHFGEDGNAVVLTLNDDPDNILFQLRNFFIGSLSLDDREMFESVQTFPDYKPHMTLGYVDEGYELPANFEIMSELYFKGLSLWNGEDHYDIFFNDSLEHYGTPRHSGRYPWGSGEDPYQRSRSFLSYVESMHKQGLSEKEIAQGLGISMRELRSRKTISKNDVQKENIATAVKLRQKQMSINAISEKMGIPSRTVYKLLEDSEKRKEDKLQATVDILKDQLKEKKFLDVGVGTEYHMNISQTQLNAALTKLKMEGYRVDKIKVEQLGTGHETQVKVLSPPGTEFGDISRNRHNIGTVAAYSEKEGTTFRKLEQPKQVDLNRVGVRYGPEGGADADGVIYVRRGVDDISLGNNKYAQVRIAVGDGHFLKGMAMYNDNMPNGVDLLFNTNKKDTGNKLDAMKEIEPNPDLPFGSIVRQNHYTDKNGKEHLSALNIVNEEGDWKKWSKTLSSQMLSKQAPALARQQLELSIQRKKDELEDIQSLTNPTIKKKLLQSFADGADAASVSLKAAALPRTANHVILPLTDINSGEIYAPKYKNGERVVLIRHPHGGRFEIPELTVNNRDPSGRKLIGNDAVDAVGIHPSVAQRLSGADFDGDTVLVIPNNKGSIKTQAALSGLKDFDPQVYKRDHSTITSKRKELEMGVVSNLITDMTIKGANTSEIARAVRHSMVVIDSEKHKLDYKQSAKDNGISALKAKYQGGAKKGASTIISQASSTFRVPERKARMAKDGGPIDPNTGEKVYVPTGATYINKNGVELPKNTKSTKMAETRDANTLSSGRPIERVYASYANTMKAMANEARKEMINTPNLKYSPSANKAYAPQVRKLKADLGVALRNAPLERQAQIIANSTFRALKRADPEMDADREKKLKGQVLVDARNKIGAGKTRISITPKDWEAIQAGAISNNMLSQILNNTDLKTIKEYATPRSNNTIPPSKLARAQAMINLGYTQAEVADALGISVSSVSNAIK